MWTYLPKYVDSVLQSSLDLTFPDFSRQSMWTDEKQAMSTYVKLPYLLASCFRPLRERQIPLLIESI